MNMLDVVSGNRGLLAAAIFMICSGSVHAAAITWGPIENIVGDGDVSTNGALVGAFNFAGSETTVNGVTFKTFPVGAPQVVSVQVDGLYTLSITPERNEHTLTTFSTSFPGAPFSNLSSAYQALLNSSAGSNFSDRINTLLMAGLTVGQSYEFQAWVNDSSRSGAFSYGLSLDGSVDMDPNTARDTIDHVVAGGLGQFVIGTFVADANSRQVEFVSGELAGGLNGFQLRAVSPTQTVPEPATLTLLGLGLAGLGIRGIRAKRTAR